MKKWFHRNDAGSLKLTVSFYIGGFKGYCWGFADNLFWCLRNLKILILKNFLQWLLLSAPYLLCLPSLVEWILYVIIMLQISLKLKSLYLYMYHDILIYWVLLAHFFVTLLFFSQCFFLYFLFLSILFFSFVLNQNYSINNFSKAYRSSNKEVLH